MVAVTQIRDEYRLEATSVGVEKVLADANRLAEAGTKGSVNEERTAVAMEKSGRARLSVASSVERLARQMDVE